MNYFYSIKNIHDKWYKDFYEIYSKSFPVYEQRNAEQQIEAFNNKHYHLDCIIENDELLSFICFWNFEEYVYIEHFAVNDKYRGKNIGTCTLLKFIETVNKTVILEIDPVRDNISAKRLKFYEKIGFLSNPYKHFHPAYNANYKPHELLVLSSASLLTSDLYDDFKDVLNKIVMKI